MGFYEQKVQAIRAALINLGIDEAELERKSVLDLPSMMDDDELPEIATFISENVGTGIQTGILCGTSRRLLNVCDELKPPWTSSWVSIEFDTITSVSSRTRPEDGVLHVLWKIEDRGMLLESFDTTFHMPGDNAKRFADFLRGQSGLSTTDSP